MRSTLYLILVDGEIYSLEIFDPAEFNKWVVSRNYHGFRNCFTNQVVKLLVCAKDGVHSK